jgi:hypothetical protein
MSCFLTHHHIALDANAFTRSNFDGPRCKNDPIGAILH